MKNNTRIHTSFTCGVIMGYYGKIWSDDILLAWPNIMQKFGHSFFVYAPKKDTLLREQWEKLWNNQQLQRLTNIARHFQNNGIHFGIGFSPYGIHKLDTKTKCALAQKMAQINSIGANIFGVFFDDIKKIHVHRNLAKNQIEIAHYLASLSRAKQLYSVPSYYCNDIILKNVLGTMPKNYWQDFGTIDKSFTIFWSGDKILSTSYCQQDSQYISEYMQRKVALWDNYPVTDPYYLQDKLALGPHTSVIPQIATWYACHAMNPMQYGWSSMLACSCVQQLYANAPYIPRQAWLDNTKKICGNAFAHTLDTYSNYFTLVGKNYMSDTTKHRIIKAFTPFLETPQKPFAQEILTYVQNTKKIRASITKNLYTEG